MRIWHDFFSEKIADMHLTEPWTLQKDDTLQVHVLKPGWKELVQCHALGRWCPDPRLEEPEFSLETVKRLLHNVVLKILEYFCWVRAQPSDLLEVVLDALVTGPHDNAHCRGCQLGICSETQLDPASNAWKPLMSVDKARTHNTLMRPYAIPTHHPSHFNSSFPWKCCCFIGSSLLRILAVLPFVLFHFT
ncbi:receptor-transporting protein 3-like [Ara ararauna]